MWQLRLDSPALFGWHLYLVFTVLDHFRVGVSVTASPFSGPEDSDISGWVNLPWFEMGFGAENNEYSLWNPREKHN